MRLVLRAVAVVAPALLALGCTGEQAGSTAEPSSSPSPVTGSPGLPGDEALTPPPPDPAAPDHVTLLAGLPVGTLSGSVELNVSGLVSFAEPVTGACTETDDGRGFESELSDGSQLRIAFGADGGSLDLTAPGVEVQQTLTAVDLRVDGGLTLAAGLLTGGTSEPSGSLQLQVVCA
jgi:hypothetical protein